MKAAPGNRRSAGFSLTEIVVVVAIIGVLASISIPAISGLNEEARNAEATDFVESLNKAVLAFSQANWDMPTPADPNATTDEFIVLRSLQYKWPAAQLKPGTPYFSPKYNPAASSSSQDYRVRWNGRTFELLKPGTAGSGFVRTFRGEDYTAADYTFPANYAPAGSQP